MFSNVVLWFPMFSCCFLICFLYTFAGPPNRTQGRFGGWAWEELTEKITGNLNRELKIPQQENKAWLKKHGSFDWSCLGPKIAPIWVVSMGRTNVKKHKLSNSKLIRGPKMPPNMNKTHNLKPPLQRLLWPQESPPGDRRRQSLGIEFRALDSRNHAQKSQDKTKIF